MERLKWIDRKNAVIAAVEMAVFDGLAIENAIEEVLESHYVVNGNTATELQYTRFSVDVNFEAVRRKEAVASGSETERLVESLLVQKATNGNASTEAGQLAYERYVDEQSETMREDAKAFVREAFRQSTPGNAELIVRGENLHRYWSPEPAVSAALARLYRLEKRYNDAILFAERGHDFNSEQFRYPLEEYYLSSARAHYERAMIHHELGYYESAIEVLRRTVELLFPFQDRPDLYQAAEFEYYHQETHHLRTRSYAMIAVIYAHTGDYENAQVYASVTNAACKSIKSADRSWFLARNAFVLAEIAFKRGEYMTAVSHYNAAGNHFAKVGDTYSERQMRFNAALCYARCGLLKQASELHAEIQRVGFATDDERAKVDLLQAEIELMRVPEKAERLALAVARESDLPAITRADAFEVAAKAAKARRNSDEYMSYLGSAYHVLQDDKGAAVAQMQKRLADEFIAASQKQKPIQ